MEIRRIVHIQFFILLSAMMLYLAQPVLMPLAIAGMFALLFMPLCRWLERKGCRTVVAAIVCGLIFVALVAGIVVFIVWHVQHIASDFSDIKQHFNDYMHLFRKYLHTEFGMDTLKKDSLKMAPLEARGKAGVVITESAGIVQQYLRGLAIVIACLWIMYTIGFSLVGVQTPVFFAILCGLLEIVPFVGNITGSTLTSLIVLSQGGGFKMVLGVLLTYAFIQAIQFYIISPLVMRTQVSLHPLFTIVVLFAGDLVWGIPGMILAIPALAIVKIICDHVDPLQSVGHLLGENRPARRKFWSRFRKAAEPGPLA